MSEITAAKIARSLTGSDNEFDESLDGWLSLTASGNVLRVKFTPVTEDGDEDKDNARHYRAVVVEGTDTPIVLERPEELGIEWLDGGDLLALTKDGITLFPNGADEWSMGPDNAREMAAHLAAMADAYEAAQAEQDGGQTDG